MATTDDLIQQAKDALERTISTDATEAAELVNVLEGLVSTKRTEQFIESEKENN